MIASLVRVFRRTKLEKVVAEIELLIRNARVVHPDGDAEMPEPVDIAVAGGVVRHIARDIAAGPATEVVDARGLLAFPGVVDAHQHWGIYSDLAADTESESRACAQGGVTTSLSYLRTGRYYLNRGGPYRDFVPDALDHMSGRSYVDHAIHLAPMTGEHIDEIPALVEEFG